MYSTKISDSYVYPNELLSINGTIDYSYVVKSPYGKFVAKEKGKELCHLIPFKGSAGTYYLLDITNYKKYEAGAFSDQEKKIKL